MRFIFCYCTFFSVKESKRLAGGGPGVVNQAGLAGGEEVGLLFF